MSQQHIPLKLTASRLVRAVTLFMTSDVGGKAKFLFFALVALFVGISVLNVVNSFVGRHFMTAIAERQTAEFIRQAILYIMAFAASTIASVIARFSEERLALLWREFLTRRAVGLYMSGGTFYRVGIQGKLTYPDQRIADDINAFTITTLSFVLMLLNSALTVVTFSGVLWVISPLLLIAAVVYAASGSYLTIVLGRPLISLSYDQLDREAAFRSSLIRVRENAEPIMLSGGEQRHTTLLLRRLDELATNFRRIIVINRNVGFFTTGYNWMTQIIPILIIAPAFIRGDMEFGVVTQSAAAFAMLVGAFSFIVSQFKSISNFAVVVARLSSLIEAMDEAGAPIKTDLEVVETEGNLAYERLTLTSPGGQTLLKDLSTIFPAGTGVVVVGGDNGGATALFRTTAGIGTSGEGRIFRPARDQLRFLAQRTQLAPGTLRQTLVPARQQGEVSDDHILALLKQLGFVRVVTVDDLDKECDWSSLLSPREQQIVAIAEALIAGPRYVLLENADVIFGNELLRDILRLLAERSIACVNFADMNTPRGAYDAVLECHADGSWRWINQGEHSVD
ncbi:SbmA/BacA-like family transporter [Rhizobium calliandrae]|uniref:SbmA/BacA-like family transporter n=1 Tax=Rhizobium calliandrae TaxID=1312182 RepID=A0ABT7KNN9_9HYPH|nr:SbmA/BacA-like family transporter [Rhizobium calliandrae]MDL2410250.1 SbmA/BacA-like family transporter [Rhizobium calliandrae]